jgi:hypothetical protein
VIDPPATPRKSLATPAILREQGIKREKEDARDQPLGHGTRTRIKSSAAAVAAPGEHTQQAEQKILPSMPGGAVALI